ncbi:hypothetical protein DYB34_010843, partial [Aphanomyces astaci]
ALMQGFQSTTGGAPDLSMVFAKLAEMRQAQTDATATLQANLDALVERQTINQDGLDGLISNVDVLNSKVGTHDSALNSRDDRDASVAKLMARQLEAQVNYQKNAVQRGLHVQERVLTTLLDLMQRVAELRQDVDKGEKGAEIQKLFQVFHHMGPQIAQVLALPPPSHEALQRIAHAIDVMLDDSEIKSSLDDQAELIASLCNDLKQVPIYVHIVGRYTTTPLWFMKSLADKATDDAAAAANAAGGARHSLSRLSNDNDPFNAKLEAITEKVAELFLSLERLSNRRLNRSNAQPRHAIPTYNPAQMLDSFAQNIEAKLAESQSLNRKVFPICWQIHDIKDELNDLVRQRVAKALERHNLGKSLLPLLNSMSPTASPTKRARKKLTSPQTTE